jgi:hypothetical protein
MIPQHGGQSGEAPKVAMEEMSQPDVVDGSSDAERASIQSSAPSTQDGVKRIEAVSQSWTRWGLTIAYVRLVELRSRDSSLCCCLTLLNKNSLCSLNIR